MQLLHASIWRLVKVKDAAAQRAQMGYNSFTLSLVSPPRFARVSRGCGWTSALVENEVVGFGHGAIFLSEDGCGCCFLKGDSGM